MKTGTILRQSQIGGVTVSQASAGVTLNSFILSRHSHPEALVRTQV